MQAHVPNLRCYCLGGGEFSGAAKDYFARPAYRQTPPKVLIWEIPERDLQTPYAGDLPVR